MQANVLKADLLRDEGLRLRMYKDTVGKWSIGVGRNLTDNGISTAEADVMLDNDVADVIQELDRNTPWWRAMPEPAQRALANMLFNMGWPRLSGFKMMLGALEAGDYGAAADHCLDSKWAGQVGRRATRIATLFRTAGTPPWPPAAA